MYCPSCGSTKQAELTAEMMIHFVGRGHLDKPGILVFPKLQVCLGCGLSSFTVPETELASIWKIYVHNAFEPSIVNTLLGVAPAQVLS